MAAPRTARTQCRGKRAGFPRHRRRAGDGNRTRTVSFEGLGLQEPSRLVGPKSGACRAFRVPQRQMAGRRSGSSLSLGQRPVECCASRRHRCPRQARRGESLLPSPSGTAHRAGHAGGWPTAWPLPCNVFGLVPPPRSVSSHSQRRQRGLRRSAACACRPIVQAARQGSRQRRSRRSPC